MYTSNSSGLVRLKAFDRFKLHIRGICICDCLSVLETRVWCSMYDK